MTREQRQVLLAVTTWPERAEALLRSVDSRALRALALALPLHPGVRAEVARRRGRVERRGWKLR